MPGDRAAPDLGADGLVALRRRWRGLAAPAVEEVAGEWRASFVGPGWLRWAGPRGVGALGLPGWEGKRFELEEDGGLAGTNLVRGGTRLEMAAGLDASAVDGRPAIVVAYGDAAPLPWRHVRDELRRLDDRRLLAMSLLDVPGGGRGALPFLLTRA